MSFVADVFYKNFQKIFRTAILKENLLMHVPYFIKKHLWMSASDKATLKKIFGGSNPSLKLVSVIFYQIFIFHQMTALQKLWKIFLFHLKSSFCSRDIQIFVFLSSPLFSPVSHCFRGWSKKNLKVYDIINFLNKNLITHFIWYLKKEIRCDIDRELNKDNFYGKIMQKMCTKS